MLEILNSPQAFFYSSSTLFLNYGREGFNRMVKIPVQNIHALNAKAVVFRKWQAKSLTYWISRRGNHQWIVHKRHWRYEFLN